MSNREGRDAIHAFTGTLPRVLMPGWKRALLRLAGL